MCHESCIDFVRSNLGIADVHGKRILEVGSHDVNGSVRSLIAINRPASYVGVDLESGPGVDYICDAGRLVDTFGSCSFDVVISTEMLEHVDDWRDAISNLKMVLAPGGILVLTTRSPGFPFHGYPADYWRFTIEDMQTIFSDMADILVAADPSIGKPGVFVRAVKPTSFSLVQFPAHKVYSIVRRAPTTHVTGWDRCRSVAFARVRPHLPTEVVRLAGRYDRKLRALLRS